VPFEPFALAMSEDTMNSTSAVITDEDGNLHRIANVSAGSPVITPIAVPEPTP